VAFEESNEDRERRQVIEYVLIESAAESVTRAERLASERIYGRRYDIWDVDASDGRWWVVTNPMNLYRHDDFPSMHAAFALHIGVTARMFARQSLMAPVDEEEKKRLAPSWRRYEQATEALDEADEAEDFQAVGMRCRECLLAFIAEVADASLLPEGVAPPKRADFVGWTEHIAAAWSSGASSARLRSYLRNVSKAAWELVNWLTHEKSASRSDGHAALDATAHILVMFSTALFRFEGGETERCPKCGSYQLGSDYDAATDVSLRICSRCDWSVVID
jgi:hypothetical protein